MTSKKLVVKELMKRDLDDLFAMCGGFYSSLVKGVDGWIAYGMDQTIGVVGATRKEAMAKLLIELQKRKAI